uniref:Uncharacterized protein n=1 Tax=Rhizophora mucronata TaxID=61149 RepID=A0A2P2MXY2_RHIMU
MILHVFLVQPVCNVCSPSQLSELRPLTVVLSFLGKVELC